MKRKNRSEWRAVVGVSAQMGTRRALAPQEGLVQVHPVPAARDHVLAIAVHVANRSAAAQGKQAPGFSEDAAAFLASRRWHIQDLARRVNRAVARNEGSLITAADLLLLD